MTQEILNADKALRKRILFLLFIFILLIGTLIQWGIPAWLYYLKRLEPYKALILIYIILILFSISLLPFGLYFLNMANCVIVEKRFPPHNVRVIKDTVVLKGKKARVRGYLLMVLSFIFMSASLIFSVLIHLLLTSLLDLL